MCDGLTFDLVLVTSSKLIFRSSGSSGHDQIAKTGVTRRSDWCLNFKVSCQPVTPQVRSIDKISGFSFWQITYQNWLQSNNGTIGFVLSSRVEWYTFCLEKVKLHVGLRSISGQRWSGQHIELGRSFCIVFASVAHCKHIGAFPDSLVQFGQELLMKNYDKLKWPLWRHTGRHKLLMQS